MPIFEKLKPIFNNYTNPKYRIMKGIQIENRCIMYLGAHPIKPRDGQSKSTIYISFKNKKGIYLRSNTYKKIHTFKQLIRWVRLLSDGNRCFNSKCLEYKNFEWNQINK